MREAIENPDHVAQMGRRGYLYSEDGLIPSKERHATELLRCYATTPFKKNGCDFMTNTAHQQTALKHLDAPWRITFDTNPDDCNLNCVMCEEHSPTAPPTRLV